MEEGGRSSPLLGGGSYRPNHNFFGADNREMCMGFIEFPEGQQVAPGDTIQTEITLWIYAAVQPEFGVGRQWRIQEGGILDLYSPPEDRNYFSSCGHDPA